MARPFLTGYQGFMNPGVSAIIAAGAQESSVIPCGGFVLAGLLLPQVFTGTALTFESGDAPEGFQATGQVVFTGTTTDGDTLTINGIDITFVDADPDAFEVLIGATAAETASNLFDFLAATADADLLACTYILSGTTLMITAIVHGVGGNAYTFAKSSSNITITPSGGTLGGGGFRPLYTAANALVSMTVAQGRAYAVDPTNFHGVLYLIIKSGSTELAARNIICTLKGF